MSEVIAFVFESEDGAKALEAELIFAQQSQDIEVGDAALVVRQADGRPGFSHAVDLVGRGSMGGIFWGFILALVFWTRWWGLSVGGALGDLRLDDDFVKEVGEAVGKGHSAMLAMVDEGMLSGVLNAADSCHPRVFQSTLSEEDEQVLKVIFQVARENA
jgi:uncharacterized membrane protein